ncbi:HTH domain-containing protein [Salinigranum sp. GCM10025319]|uniref:HTH domain-containing protein n=1 Tax=Salinigranum sp. GCM10025319 TaxID=3252687 RepID=UPI0036199773
MSFTISSADARQVTFYVRGDMFGANDQQNAVVDRLRELDDDDVIEGYDVRVWNSRVRLTGTETPAEVEQYRAFESWADAANVDIDPFFTVRERDSFVDGTARELILPVMCLAVHGDDGLEAVAPCARGDETYTVRDCLAELETPDAPARRVTVPAED